MQSALLGSENNDEMSPEGFLTNHAGGILGGISTGADIIVRIAVKPTPSISRKQQTVNVAGKPVTISVQGRHDPCIAPRIVPVAEAMIALVLVDGLLEQTEVFRVSGPSEEYSRLIPALFYVIKKLNPKKYWGRMGAVCSSRRFVLHIIVGYYPSCLPAGAGHTSPEGRGYGTGPPQ